MKSLQLWLAVLGGLVLAAVIAHGTWQARRAGGGRRQSLPPASRHMEPVFDDAGTGSPESAGGSQEPAAPPLVVPPVRRAPSQPRLDARVDALAGLSVEAPVSGETLLAHLPPSRRAGGKPFFIEGREQGSGEWEAPTAGRWYREVQAGVQLANRMGPLNEIEYSEFVQKIQAFADAISALPDFPDMLDVVARARELDAFAGAHDAQLAMRLQPQRGPWPLPFVQAHAARHGFVAGATPGRMVLPSAEEGAPAMLALHFDPQAALADDPRQARIDEVSLVFDVPQTPAGDQPFNAWCAAGRALALGLDARVSDDKGQPLPTDALGKVGTDLGSLYEELAEQNLPAGSPAARRLFS
ncbi:MAG: cell division protein FtsZ [Burkholderiales bacterium]|jgi:hypothetical protein|nr:cell division protein FtsZ [Burkholderiales bacterium]MBP7521675.1 cell division protein FtsZ [Leptothrix sp. (in: b-proteobacteria)]HQY09216.1 cell division protein FtsZ [Burkholderiaceae bacterium]